MNRNTAIGYLWLAVALAILIAGYQLGVCTSVIISQIWMSK